MALFASRGQRLRQTLEHFLERDVVALAQEIGACPKQNCHAPRGLLRKMAQIDILHIGKVARL